MYIIFVRIPIGKIVMSDIQKSLEHLSAALKYLPNDFKLETARGLVRKSINEIQTIEKKKYKKSIQQTKIDKESPRDKWTNGLTELLKLNAQPKATLNKLNELIKKELDKISQKQPKADGPEILLNN